jgi:hypothetical protein
MKHAHAFFQHPCKINQSRAAELTAVMWQHAVDTKTEGVCPS